MVFGKKKAPPATTTPPKATSSSTSKEQPKKPEAKHDLAAKLREQKAQREADEKAVKQDATASTAAADDAVSNKKSDAGESSASAKIDKEWEAKLKEIMRETGEDADGPRPKGRVVTKPDGSKMYVYDNAYGAAVDPDKIVTSAKAESATAKTKSRNEADGKTTVAVPPADHNDMKGFDEFYSWVKNGKMADIDQCESVMFGTNE